MLIEQMARRVTIIPESFEKIKEFVYDTAKGGPEHCGNMKIHYHPYLGYIISEFLKEQETEHRVECVPRIGTGQGLWHTHPSGFCGASSTDYHTMYNDAKSSIKGITPGVPPLNLIITLKGETLCIKAYLPSWNVDYQVLDNYPYVIESIKPILNGNYLSNSIYDYYGIIVEENTDRLTGKRYFQIRITGELDADEINNNENYGVYIGSHVPPHAIAALLAFLAQFRREFWVYHELYGLMKIHVSGASPIVVEVPVKVEPAGFGRELRLVKLEKDHNYPLSKIYSKSITVFGVGFIGSRIVELLSSYVGKIIVLDIDSVGPENLGYQALYTVEDLNKYKVNVIARELLKRHMTLRVIPVRSLIPTSKHGLTQLIDDVVSRSDLVITSFDTLEPRLTVQLAAAKHRKPLIDVAVGVSDGEVRIWYPGSKLACPGCYIVQKPSETIGRSIYASKPHLAALLAGLAVEEAINILLGRKSEYNRIKILLDENGLSINRESIEEDPACPYHRSECKLVFHFTRAQPMEAKIVVQARPWDKASTFIKSLSNILGRSFKVRALRRDESIHIEDVSNTWLCQMQRLGYKLQLDPKK